MLALGHEVFDADGARFVRDRRLPDIWEANRVTAVTASSDAAIDRLLARAEREYADLGHRRFDLDFATPPAFEARLLLDGLPAREFLVMVLERRVAGSRRRRRTFGRAPTPRRGRPTTRSSATTGANPRSVSACSRAVSAHRWSTAIVAGVLPRATGWRGSTARRAAFCRRGKGWMASARSRICTSTLTPAAVASRRRSSVTASLTAGEAGAGPVVIVADADDTPRLAYSRMGFRAVAVSRAYLRRLSSSR